MASNKVRSLVGVVSSDKMDKTVSVIVERVVQHPRYRKYIKQRTKFKAHDGNNDAKNGDLVRIESARPLSKSKNWRMVEILKTSQIPT